MNELLKKAKTVTLFTGTNGRNECTANCPACFQGDMDNIPKHQGTSAQVYELMDALPNMNRVVIFGNPDSSCDTEFCNETAQILQKRNIETLFCTNGVNCFNTVKRLISGLNPALVYRMVFSIDSLNEAMNSEIKGREIPLDDIFKSIDYLHDIGIKCEISFTIWPNNVNEDWSAFKNFFESRGVFINGRFGNIEQAGGRIQHVSQEEILRIRKEHSDVRLGILLANEEEYKDYMVNFVDHNRFRCTDFSKLNAVFTQDGIKATFFCPSPSTVYPEYFVDIHNIKSPTFQEEMFRTGICPVAFEAMGFKSNNLQHICRFYKKPDKKTLPT